MPFNPEEFRSHFPALEQHLENGQPLVYFDTAASSLKPKEVADRIHQYYLYEASNIHRGAHWLSRKGTENYESVREKVAQFIGSSSNEVIFTRGVTESVNLFMYAWALENCEKGDTILLSPFEHHSNIVPWQMLAEKKGCLIQQLVIDDMGHFDLDEAKKQLGSGSAKIASLMLYSNVTGVRLNVEPLMPLLKEAGVKVMIDAAQAVLTEKIDVKALDCDLLTFSGHKMLGPYGVGVLYGKYDFLQAMPPFHGGGSMISRVDWDSVVYQDAPFKFEAGTPNVGGVLGLGAAIDFINSYGIDSWQSHEEDLVLKIEERLQQSPQVSLLTAPKKRSPIVSFTFEGAHSSDVGEILDQMGVAVRAGHHCAQPLMNQKGLVGTARVSLGPYNSIEDVEAFSKAFEKVENLLS